MTNKKSVMAFSALLILSFHLWIYIFPGNGLEEFLKQTAYVGVDMFFFLSGYSLAGRKIQGYLPFIGTRFLKVYVKFIVLAIVAGLYGSWSLARFFKVISGNELLSKGGGSFLWFLPAIMIFYIVYPLFQRFSESNPLAAFILTFILWIGVGLTVSLFTGYRAMFIFWNRLPVFLVGHYCSSFRLWDKLKEQAGLQLALGIVLTIVGYLLVFFFGFRGKIQQPLPDMFYVAALPLCLGLVLLVSLIPEKGIIKYIGSSTLELYGLQMIFGYKLAGKIYILTGSAWATNLLILLVFVVFAVALQLLIKLILSVFQIISTIVYPR